MFIKYQHVRNVVMVTVVVGLGSFFAYQSQLARQSSDENSSPNTLVSSNQANNIATSLPAEKVTPPVETGKAHKGTDAPNGGLTSGAPLAQAEAEESKVGPTTTAVSTKSESNEERYVAAMTIATRAADPGGRGKDVLGAASPWKLNLYDDDKDGQWDRAKLDTNRDETDDEKWNFKNGVWEKDGGHSVWSGDAWVVRSTAVAAEAQGTLALEKNENRSVENTNYARYREAMKIATSRADASGKGKDVLGSSNPWKLNLYDDDKDGQWDRGKLDYDRDEVDDEKWNYKNGHWEKDGGATIWNGDQWVKP